MNIETHSNNLKAIREQLLQGWRITVLSVLQSVGTIELRKYVSMLRKEGYKILDRWMKNGKKRYKEYYLQVA